MVWPVTRTSLSPEDQEIGTRPYVGLYTKLKLLVDGYGSSFADSCVGLHVSRFRTATDAEGRGLWSGKTSLTFIDIQKFPCNIIMVFTGTQVRSLPVRERGSVACHKLNLSRTCSSRRSNSFQLSRRKRTTPAEASQWSARV